MGRPGKYLFKRQNSANWHLRLTYPPGYVDPDNPSKTKAIRRVKEQSLCTPNYREAEAIAAPLIAEHKKNLWAHHNEKAKRYVYEYAPSLYPPGKTYELEPGEEWDLPEGGSVDSTETHLTFYDKDGNLVAREPHELPAVPSSVFDPAILPRRRNEVSTAGYKLISTTNDHHGSISRYYAPVGPALKRQVKANLDDKIIAQWVKMKGVSADTERRARALVRDLAKVTGGKSLTEINKADVRALRDKLASNGVKPQTIKRQFSTLSAAISVAMSDGLIGSSDYVNPFEKMLYGKIIRITREAFTDEDMVLVRSRIKELDDNYQLLWILLATTGMRLSEAFQIAREEPSENTARFAKIGRKTETSKRRVPFVDELHSYLPTRVTSPLFTRAASTMDDKLNSWLKGIGINKSLHGLRHRAATRMRNQRCPVEIRWALLGHNIKTEADMYGGGGPPIEELHDWATRIGW